MSDAVQTQDNRSIDSKAFLLPKHVLRQKECLSAPVIEEFAALFWTAQEPVPYDASPVESLTVHWKGAPVQWNPARVQWKASPVQWKDQLSPVESWSSQLHSQFLEAVLCFSAIRF